MAYEPKNHEVIISITLKIIISHGVLKHKSVLNL